MQTTINQRIKFLLENFNLSARAFGKAIGVGENTTQNYLEPRLAQPRADYLERILLHFGSINPQWLLTGEGQPFLSAPTENTPPTLNAQKIFRSQIIGSNQGTANHQQNTTSGAEKLETELALMRQQVEHLQQQLAAKDNLLQSKDEIIDLLKRSK